MILTETFTNQLSILNNLDEENFEKAVIFAFNTFQEESKVGLHDMLLMDEDKAQEILTILLKLILFCSKFKTSLSELDAWMESTPLTDSRQRIFKEKLLLYLDQIRGRLHSRVSSEQQLKGIDWRFQVTVSSKTASSQFQPEVVLDFVTSKRQHSFMTCDFSNLRNLFEELSNAYKQHDNSTNKKIRNSFL